MGCFSRIRRRGFQTAKVGTMQDSTLARLSSRCSLIVMGGPQVARDDVAVASFSMYAAGSVHGPSVERAFVIDWVPEQVGLRSE